MQKFVAVCLLGLLLTNIACGLAILRHNIPKKGVEYRLSRGTNTDETACIEWLNMKNDGLRSKNNIMFLAEWDWASNVTDYNEEQKKLAGQEWADFKLQAFQEALDFDATNFGAETRRELSIWLNIYQSALPTNEFTQYQEVQARMETIYSNARVCMLQNPDDNCYTIEPTLVQQMASSSDYYQLQYIWKEWRDVSGREMREDFVAYLDLMKKAATANHFNSATDMWLAPYTYDEPNFQIKVEKLMEEYLPIYQVLHAYVRERLRDHYRNELGADVFPESGHIPAHLLGNMWAQGWSNVKDMVLPYPTKPVPDVSDAMLDAGYVNKTLYEKAEEFFVSIGLDPMTQTFWNKSIIEQPTDREMICHASAWDFYSEDKQDFRIKQCTQVREDDFVTVHHEMGHIEYFMEYANQKTVFMESANPGFHEGLGDVIALSVMSMDHLKEIGLLPNDPTDPEVEVNFLMSMALRKMSFIPFGYLIDKYRWDLFDGQNVKLNDHWWKLRCELQGLSPPVTRSESDFDPGAKYHIPASVPYIRYFVAHLVQFQIHEALCRGIGFTQDFHRCSIYNSKEAGAKLRAMMQDGSSKSWVEQLRNLTGSGEMSIQPMKDYFRPVLDFMTDYLNKRDIKTGWQKGDDDNGCPIPASYKPTFTAQSASSKVLSVVLVMFWLL